MKKALFVLSMFSIIGLSCPAQTSSDGLIIFRNINIATSQPNPDLPGYIAGSNDNGTYNVPIYTDYSGNGGAGLLPGGVTVGLFTETSPVPVATGLLGTQANTAAFIVTPVSQTVTVTGYPPGSTPTLIVRAWQTSFGAGWNGFNAAKAAGGRWAEWSFISPPLGGVPPGGGSAIRSPTMTGWGNPSGNGVSLALLSPISFTRINSPTNGSAFTTPATVSVTGEVIIPTGANFVLTNLSLFNNGALIASQSGSATTITASTPSLDVGSYALTSVAMGYLQLSGQVWPAASYTSAPVNITVVAPPEDGKIIFKNAGVVSALGTRYNVPIYRAGSTTSGAGLLPGGVTVGLFTQNGTVPLATGLMGTQPNNAAFIFTPLQQTVTVSGFPPGSTPTLVVRAWQTLYGTSLDGFNAAKAGGGAWGEWSFTSAPLGGMPVGGGTEIPIPEMTGWGDPSGAIPLVLYGQSDNWSRIDSPANGAIFGAPATVTVTGTSYFSVDGNSFVVTNLSLFSNGVLFGSKSGSGSSLAITTSTSPLAAGSYVLTSVASGYWVGGGSFGSYTSAPVNITVVEAWGKIRFSNVNIPTVGGEGVYNLPVWADWSQNVGAGRLPGGATVALYREDMGWDDPPLAAVNLGLGDNESKFFSAATTVDVVGVHPGVSAPLIIRAWRGTNYNDTVYKREWRFTSKPLGGVPLDGGAEVPTPGLTGWGYFEGFPDSGVYLGALSIWPWPRITTPAKDLTVAADELHITGEVVMESNMGECVLTNLSLFANSTLLRSQNGQSPTISISTNLSPGAYALTLVSSGYFQSQFGDTSYGPHTSAPVNVTVVKPVDVIIAVPRFTSSQLQFEYTANPGLKYVIKTSADLFDWQPIATNIPTANPAVFSQPFNPTATRYFKVDRLPNP